MAKASVHIVSVPGFFGDARCFRFDPPRVLDGVEREFVTVVVSPAIGMHGPSVSVYPGREDGGCATRQLVRQTGSFTPAAPVDVEGCYALALMMLGVTELETSEAAS
ncbi:hypothetical protein [Nocardia puris]|uniref:Uncharacterized protein n=1 Tax=Nocardia puris TaxID=208602 RepID=A0A366DAC9_9NOCA|nr:hypothetical protein [Nocardia puris]RBO87012.1 hypothetical protein DFR74_112189 [Nocardia puris]